MSGFSLLKFFLFRHLCSGTDHLLWWSLVLFSGISGSSSFWAHGGWVGSMISPEEYVMNAYGVCYVQAGESELPALDSTELSLLQWSAVLQRVVVSTLWVLQCGCYWAEPLGLNYNGQEQSVDMLGLSHWSKPNTFWNHPGSGRTCNFHPSCQ